MTRVDVAGNAVRTFDVPGLVGTAIAYEAGSLWLLSTQPARVFCIDPATGAVRQTVALAVPFPLRRALVETWWLSGGDGALWATFPSNRGVARIDTATGAVRYVPVLHGESFGVAVGGGRAWVATDRAVWALDAASGDARAASLTPRSGGFGLVSIAFADGAAWLTSYDRGTLVRVS